MYDLRQPGRNYESLHSYLKTLDWWHCLDSTWLVETSKTATTIRDDMLVHIDTNDGVLVVTLGNKNWATYGMKHQNCIDWLKTHLA
jgi:hypothetical protein